MANQLRIYSAESQVRHLKDVLRAMWSGLIHSRYMAYRLCRKDIRAEYAKSAFGVVWDFCDPLVLGCVFFLLMKVRAINPGNMTMPYAVFVIYGLLLYQTFCESVTMSLSIVERSKSILTHLKLPPEALIMSVFFRILFNSFFRIIVMLVFSVALNVSAKTQGLNAFSAIGFIKFVFLYPPFILLGMSIGIFLAPFNVIYGDVGRIVRIILFPLRYISQVIFAIPTTGPLLSWLYILNPIALTLDNLRSIATSDIVLDPFSLGIRFAFFGIVFLFGWLIFHLSIPVLAERA